MIKDKKDYNNNKEANNDIFWDIQRSKYHCIAPGCNNPVYYESVLIDIDMVFDPRRCKEELPDKSNILAGWAFCYKHGYPMKNALGMFFADYMAKIEGTIQAAGDDNNNKCQ